MESTKAQQDIGSQEPSHKSKLDITHLMLPNQDTQLIQPQLMLLQDKQHMLMQIYKQIVVQEFLGVQIIVLQIVLVAMVTAIAIIVMNAKQELTVLIMWVQIMGKHGGLMFVKVRYKLVQSM